jgi:hypothetical protein
MAETGGGLIESILQMPGEFASIATQSPEQAILVAIGSIIIGVAGVGFGVLAAGGVLKALARGMPSSGQPPRDQHQR